MIKKTVSLLLAVMMLTLCGAAVAEDATQNLGFLDFLSDFDIEGLGQTIQEATQSLNTAIEEIKQDTETGLAEVTENLGDALQNGDKWSDKLDAFTDMLKDKWDDVKTQAGELWDGASEWMDGAWDGASAWLSDKWEDAKTWIKKAWGDASEWIEKNWNDPDSKIRKIWGEAADWISEKSEKIIAWLKEAFEKVTEYAGKVWEWVKGLKTEDADLFAQVEEALTETEVTEQEVQETLGTLGEALSLTEDDNEKIWDTVEAYAQDRQIEPATLGQLALPYMLQLNADAEGQEEIPGAAVAQFLTAVFEKTGINGNDDAESSLTLLRNVIGE